MSLQQFLPTRFHCATFLLIASGMCAGQILKPRPPDQRLPAPTSAAPQSALTVPMTVPSGTPIKVALDSEVRIREVGQAIHGKTTEPIYAFDKVLIPVGTAVNGTVSAIDSVP